MQGGASQPPHVGRRQSARTGGYGEQRDRTRSGRSSLCEEHEEFTCGSSSGCASVSQSPHGRRAARGCRGHAAPASGPSVLEVLVDLVGYHLAQLRPQVLEPRANLDLDGLALHLRDDVYSTIAVARVPPAVDHRAFGKETLQVVDEPVLLAHVRNYESTAGDVLHL